VGLPGKGKEVGEGERREEKGGEGVSECPNPEWCPTVTSIRIGRRAYRSAHKVTTNTVDKKSNTNSNVVVLTTTRIQIPLLM